jgi:hypothetical protein
MGLLSPSKLHAKGKEGVILGRSPRQQGLQPVLRTQRKLWVRSFAPLVAGKGKLSSKGLNGHDGKDGHNEDAPTGPLAQPVYPAGLGK